MSPALRGFPFARLGLLLVVGSVVASAFQYYVAFAQTAGDLDSKEMPADRQAALDQFLKDFLFTGSIASVLCWAGIAMMIVGIVRNLVARVSRSH